MNRVVLGFDTSNYTTSVSAVTVEGQVLYNGRKLLNVKQGDRGLRQSDALFQHWNNLPELIRGLKEAVPDMQVEAIAVSEKPRQEEGSYMPVFLAGLNMAESLASLFDVPVYRFSHQQGHVRAAADGTPFMNSKVFLSYHLSGGTTELLLVENNHIKIVGGTRDLAFGQILDRTGVAAGLKFPAGAEMDKLAVTLFREPGLGNQPCAWGDTPGEKAAWTDKHKLKQLPKFKPVKYDGLFYSISGLENQGLRMLSEGTEHSVVFAALLSKISEIIIDTVLKAKEEFDAEGCVFAGGVSSSLFFRGIACKRLSEAGCDFAYGPPEMSTDNAAGIGLLGADEFGKSR